MPLSFQTLPFTELSVDQLYGLLRLRQEVFVVEQTCWYLDADGRDQAALHLLGTDEAGRLAAYARLLPRGVSYPEYASIGRVLTAEFARGRGYGRPLMKAALAALFAAWGEQAVKISAQAHLQAYYGSVGFVGVGEVYDEDGIPHRAMLFNAIAASPNN